MIVRPLRPAQPFYRMLTPRWAVAPKSGIGAAKKGARFNRPGVEAIYLSLDVATASAEYQQDTALMPPGTLVTYQVALNAVVDFSEGYKAGQWDPVWEDWNCEWRRLAFNLRIEPPSWLLGDLVIEAKAPGILFPSTQLQGGINIVIFPQILTPADLFEPFDPRGDLPRNQDSWLNPN